MFNRQQFGGCQPFEVGFLGYPLGLAGQIVFGPTNEKRFQLEYHRSNSKLSRCSRSAVRKDCVFCTENRAARAAALVSNPQPAAGVSRLHD